MNVVSNPYIVTRNGTTPGGEVASNLDPADRQRLIDARSRALAVYDRAMLFMIPPIGPADVSGRQQNETTLSVWSRFKSVSDALASYLSFAIDLRAVVVSRIAIENADDLSDDSLLTTIPVGERLDPGFALAQLDTFMASQEFRASHSGFPNDSLLQYLRIIRVGCGTVR